jgi:hypothetical protein
MPGNAGVALFRKLFSLRSKRENRYNLLKDYFGVTTEQRGTEQGPKTWKSDLSADFADGRR